MATDRASLVDFPIIDDQRSLHRLLEQHRGRMFVDDPRKILLEAWILYPEETCMDHSPNGVVEYRLTCY